MMTKPHQARNQLKIILIPLFTGLVLFLCVKTIAQPANDKDNSSLSEDKRDAHDVRLIVRQPQKKSLNK
jgi:hypothetical protein